MQTKNMGRIAPDDVLIIMISTLQYNSGNATQEQAACKVPFDIDGGGDWSIIPQLRKNG
jgi:hypothetical protein